MAKRNDEHPERTSVGVTVEARDALVAYLATKHNPVMRDVVSTLIRRFLELPDAVKSAALNTVDPDMELAYADALQDMARQLIERWEKRHGVKRQGTRRSNGTAVTPPPRDVGPEPAPDATRNRR